MLHRWLALSVRHNKQLTAPLSWWPSNTQYWQGQKYKISKQWASILISSEKRPSDEYSKKNTEHSVWISNKHYSTSYTFVCVKQRTKRIVLANTKARGTTFDEVITDITKWCENRNVSISGISPLPHPSERKFSTFVTRANIDFDDYENTQNAAF